MKSLGMEFNLIGFHKKGKIWTQRQCTKGEPHVKMKTEICGMCLQAKECQTTSSWERGMAQF